MALIETKLDYRFDDGKRHYYSIGENCFASSVARSLANEDRSRSRSCYDYAITDVYKNLYEIEHGEKDFTVLNITPNVFGSKDEYCVAMKDGTLYCHFKPERGSMSSFIKRMENNFANMCMDKDAIFVVSFVWYDDLDTVHIDNVLPSLLERNNTICCVPMEYPNNRGYNLDSPRVIRYAFKKGNFGDTCSELWDIFVGQRRSQN